MHELGTGIPDFPMVTCGRAEAEAAAGVDVEEVVTWEAYNQAWPLGGADWDGVVSLSNIPDHGLRAQRKPADEEADHWKCAPGTREHVRINCGID
jgi:hypothetical protein